MLVYNLSWIIKNSQSNYPCHDIYIQHYIHYNMRNQNEYSINHTPGPCPSLAKIIRFLTRENKVDN